MAPQWGNIFTLKFGTLRHRNEAAMLFTSLSKTGIVIFNQRQQRWERERVNNEPRTTKEERYKQKRGKWGGGGITCLHINRRPHRLPVPKWVMTATGFSLFIVMSAFLRSKQRCRSNPTKHDTTTGLDANQRRGWGRRRIQCLGLEHGELARGVSGEFVREVKAHPSR